MMPELEPIDVHEWIRRLELIPHPEGGYFRETYRSSLRVCPTAKTDRDRSASTAIYFLLANDDFSALHRIASDEVWHFYCGCSLQISAILPGGELRVWRLGTNVAAGDLPQCVVPAGAWFGAEIASGRGREGRGNVRQADAYALVGCTVAPGFEFADFELGNRRMLVAEYPRHASVIARLTRVLINE